MRWFIAFLGLGLSLAAFGNVREVDLKTEKIKGADGKEAVHWMPSVVEVAPGEKIKIVAKHDLEGGFDFHGLFIPLLKISEKVTRHQPTMVNVTVPASMKPGEYEVKCQFHPAHVAAKLVVKGATTP